MSDSEQVLGSRQENSVIYDDSFWSLLNLAYATSWSLGNIYKAEPYIAQLCQQRRRLEAFLVDCGAVLADYKKASKELSLLLHPDKHSEENKQIKECFVAIQAKFNSIEDEVDGVRTKAGLVLREIDRLLTDKGECGLNGLNGIVDNLQTWQQRADSANQGAKKIIESGLKGRVGSEEFDAGSGKVSFRQYVEEALFDVPEVAKLNEGGKEKINSVKAKCLEKYDEIKGKSNQSSPKGNNGKESSFDFSQIISQWKQSLGGFFIKIINLLSRSAPTRASAAPAGLISNRFYESKLPSAVEDRSESTVTDQHLQPPSPPPSTKSPAATV